MIAASTRIAALALAVLTTLTIEAPRAAQTRSALVGGALRAAMPIPPTRTKGDLKVGFHPLELT